MAMVDSVSWKLTRFLFSSTARQLNDKLPLVMYQYACCTRRFTISTANINYVHAFHDK